MHELHGKLLQETDTSLPSKPLMLPLSANLRNRLSNSLSAHILSPPKQPPKPLQRINPRLFRSLQPRIQIRMPMRHAGVDLQPRLHPVLPQHRPVDDRVIAVHVHPGGLDVRLRHADVRVLGIHRREVGAEAIGSGRGADVLDGLFREQAGRIFALRVRDVQVLVLVGTILRLREQNADVHPEPRERRRERLAHGLLRQHGGDVPAG